MKSIHILKRGNMKLGRGKDNNMYYDVHNVGFLNPYVLKKTKFVSTEDLFKGTCFLLN